MGLETQFVPMLPQASPSNSAWSSSRPSETQGRYPDKEGEKEEARNAARKQAHQEIKAGSMRRKMSISAKYKSFTYLVRQKEETPGWTGEFGDSGPDQHWSQNKKRKNWHSNSIDVEANVTWMKERILQNLADRQLRAGKGVVVDVADIQDQEECIGCNERYHTHHPG